ncbi:MAG: stage V sporulation protein AD [Eubacteriales bacterium]
MRENKRLGKRTVRLAQPPVILGEASIVGKKEGEGPLRDCFDHIEQDTTFGQDTWERAESHMQTLCLRKALEKASLAADRLHCLFAGDLLNQCIGSTYGLREFGVPMAGLFGACSTMAEGLALAAMNLDGGFSDYAAAITSSHFCTAERQFRMPLEYGGQRPPTAQWTVTGSGAMVLSAQGEGPRITHCTLGRIVDMGVTDANHMGGAMAPAACDTLEAYFQDTGTRPQQYDLIVTGDLGYLGRGVVLDQFQQQGMELAGVYDDCGCMIYDASRQDVNSGGSGCGCSAVVLAGYILPRLRSGEWKDVLFVGTGALMSPTACQQGESIPGIAHLVRIQSGM